MKRWHILRRLWKPFADCQATVYAASACFYFFLSLLPCCALLFSVISFLPSGEIRNAALRGILSEFRVLLGSTNVLPLFSLPLITLLWSASKSILAIFDGLNAVLPSQKQLHFIRRRVLSIFYFLALLAGIVLVLILQVFAGQLLQLLYRLFPLSHDAIAHLFPFRTVYTLGILTVLFFLIYRIFPSDKLPYRSCLLGAVSASAGWSVFSFFFSVYTERYARHQQLYGGIGLVMLFCIWLHACLVLFFYGGLLSYLHAQDQYHPLQTLREFFQGRS